MKCKECKYANPVDDHDAESAIWCNMGGGAHNREDECCKPSWLEGSPFQNKAADGYNNNVFYKIGVGEGIRFNGTCGFKIGITNIGNEKYNTVRICPLIHKQCAGEIEEGNGIDNNAPFIDLSFIKPDSVDVVIEVLQILKKQMEE